MPNWCYNGLRVHHNDPEMIDKFVKGFKKEGLFNTFIPYPKNDDGEVLIDWCHKNWGTKWDIQPSQIEVLDDEDKNEITIGFSSAWSPPIPFYDKLVELGFEVEADYEEGGWAFVGIYSNGFDECLDFPQNLDDFDKLPYDFQEKFDHLKQNMIMEAKENQ